MSYQLTVGLEIHVELKTKTKMFCRCLNDPEEKRPNTNICPVCTAQPGALPVINFQAVKQILRVGLAVGGRLADFTEFDRKNYFYPDIPKGYQISQYKYPLVSGGELSGVSITRIHLEEDTAKSFHDEQRGESLIDFNRSSLPLMELVTEPVIKEAKVAGNFARELQILLRYLGVSEASMEKGQMRIEANISVSDNDVLGTKVEVKNLNSFRSVERAIAYEYDRQVKELTAGKKIVQETRGWNENKNQTFSQRLKESSHDYRYFPDPDLPKLYLSQVPEFAKLAETLPELPGQKRQRYLSTYGLKSEDVAVLVQDEVLAEFFDQLAGELSSASELLLASNYLTSDILGWEKTSGRRHLPAVQHFAELIKMISVGEVSSRGAKDILRLMLEDEETKAPRQLAEERGLFQEHDDEKIKAIVEQIIADHSEVVAEYRQGKDKSLQFLLGQAMKVSRGTANPQVLTQIFKQLLS